MGTAGWATPAALALMAVLAPAPGAALAAGEGEGPTAVVVAADDDEVRAAVRFPLGWRLESVTDPSRLAINALGVDERCELSTRHSSFDDPATDVDDLVIGLGPGSGFNLLERAEVELPAGTAQRVDLSDEAGAHWSVYVVPDGRHLHELWCRGDELPVDRWLPIAQTFALAPQATLASSPFDPAVVRVDAGVAMAFGEEWHVRGSSTRLGLLYATGPSGVCSLSDYGSLADENGWAGMEDMHAAYVATAGARDGLSVEANEYLDLPAGRTGMAELRFEDGTTAVRYSFGEPVRGSLVALFCLGDPLPDDRYRSLAETVTWLPAEDRFAAATPAG